MHEKKFIDDAQYAHAMAAPIESKFHGPVTEVDAPNVAEMVRVDLLDRIGTQVYADGYRVVTTIDSRLQQAAAAAVRTGVIDYDQRHGYRGPTARPVFAANAAEPDWLKTLEDYPELGGLAPAVIVLADAAGATAFTRDHGRIRLSLASMKWARPALPDGAIGKPVEKTGDVIAAGDIVYVAQDVSGAWHLMQPPQVQGATFRRLEVGEVGAIAKNAWPHALACDNASQTIFDVVSESRFALLPVTHYIHASGDLLAHDLCHGGTHPPRKGRVVVGLV